MKILIKNGHVIDPDTKLDQVADVLLEDDKIQEVKENIKEIGRASCRERV